MNSENIEKYVRLGIGLNARFFKYGLGMLHTNKGLLYSLVGRLKQLSVEQVQYFYIQAVALEYCFLGLKTLSSPSDYKVEGKTEHNFQSLIYEYFGGFRFGKENVHQLEITQHRTWYVLPCST